ncbi:MAG TPA: hemolysin family protein [Myxococcales bacterium]
MWDLLQILLLMLLLVLANGLFAAAEISVVSVRRSRIRQLVDEGNRRALAVEKLHGDTERFLATIQIGINLVGALGAAIGGASLAEPLAGVLRAAPVAFVAGAAEQIALGTVVLGFTFVSILLGELIPKSLALRYAEPWALAMARWLLRLGALMRPAVWLLTGAANVVLKPFRDRTTFTESRLTAEEIKLLIGEAAESGAIEKRGAEIIERAVDFGELTVADVLIPRRRVVSVDLEAAPDEIRRVLLEEGHTRMPVVDGNLDKVVGYITAKDVIAFVAEEKLIVLQDIVRPAFFVPSSMRAIELLRTLQKRREHMAVAVDEYGGTAGIVTTEDLVEEIVGDLFSEDAPVSEDVRQEPGGTALVQAHLPIREFNRAFDAEVPDQDFDTVGGLVTHLAGAIPQVGQAFTAHGFEFTVTERSERRVKQVRVKRTGSPPP